MGGRVLNLKFNHTVSAIQERGISNLKHPFSKYIDKNPTEVTFYNVNNETSFDPSTGDAYSQVGADSPFFFDKISGLILYGIGRIEFDIDMTEYGPESSPIQGEAYLMPNTIIPLPGSYFTINSLKGKKLLFKVTAVNRDGPKSGANWWKLDYMADLVGVNLEGMVTRRFKFLAGNVGTEFACVVEDESYNALSNLETLADDLRRYYFDMFFRKNIQTFVYKYNNFDVRQWIYDPYLIEFLIRNDVMYGSNEFEYITHACVKPPRFETDYDKSIFHAIETKNLSIEQQKVYARKVTDPMSLMVCRLESYYAITVRADSGRPLSGVFADPIERFDPDFILALYENRRFDPSDYRYYWNLILDLFYDDDSNINDYITAIRNVDMIPCRELYYMLPFVIYSIDQYILSKLKTNDDGTGYSNGSGSITNIASVVTAVNMKTIDTDTVKTITATSSPKIY